MFGKVSSSQGRVSLSGSGALSHVYIQHPLLRCNIPEIQGLYYDDGNKLLLAPTSDQVLSWKIGQSTQLDAPNSDPIGEGPVVSIRYSLDQKIIGIQRSNHEVEFRNRETGQSFFRRCRPDSESILGFFWTDCPSCDIILIKTRMPTGQEKFTFIADLKGWGYSNSDIRAYIASLDIMQNNYPERLGKVLLIHVPYIFMKAWKIVYPFIDKNTKKKFVFVEEKHLQATLLEDIDESQLPELYGGKLPLIPIEKATE